MERERHIRTGMGIASVALLAALCLLALTVLLQSLHIMSALMLGNIVFPALIYTVIRWRSPSKPRYGLELPGLIFLGLSGLELIPLLIMWAFLSGNGFPILNLILSLVGLVPCYICELFLRSSVKPCKLAAAAAGIFGMLLCICADEYTLAQKDPALHPIGMPVSFIGLVISGILVLTAVGVMLYYTINAPSGARLRTTFASAVTMLVSAGMSVPLWGFVCFWGGPELLHSIF